MKITTQVNKKSLFIILFSTLFSIVVALIPWWSLRGNTYYDRENYIFFIDIVPNKLEWFNFDGILSKIMNEWGWHKFLQVMISDFGLTSGPILFIVTFLSVFTASIFLTKRYFILSFLFLLNPIFIDFAVSQLRLAFAMSILMIGYWLYSKKNFLYIPILLATPFIHTSTVLFIFIIGMTLILSKANKIPAKIKTIISLVSGVIVSIVTGPLMSVILSRFEDRRAEYNDMSSPLLYMIFWLVLYFYFLIKGIMEKSEKSFTFYISISVMTMIVMGLIFGGYPLRFVAACFPFIIAAILDNKGKEKHIIIYSYVFFTLVLWGFWFT